MTVVPESLVDEAPGGAKAPVIAARGLDVGFGAVPYVRGLDLEVRPGEIVAMLGANGAGKTTTLMGLAGVLKPSAGHVELNGQKVTAGLHARARAGLAVITQERCVFMGLSLRDNLRVGRCDPDAALETFPELKPHMNRTVGLLSGGQQQMLAVARVIARRPTVLLADELSLGLAPMVIDRILEALVEACARDGLGVLMVEQQVSKALSVANRGAVMRRGRLELVDDAKALLGQMDAVEKLYL
jgi:ABC-type branched-subunit amino acid transport system ATPase component